MTKKQIHIMYWIIIALIIGAGIAIALSVPEPTGYDDHDLKIQEAETKIEFLEAEVAKKDSLLLIKDENIAARDSVIANKKSYIEYIPVKYEKERITVLSLSDTSSVKYLSDRLNGR